MNKYGVSNIVLMTGIAISMALLLVGGFTLVTKLVEEQARSAPEFIANELKYTIETISAAPESASFFYFVPQDKDFFPVIGSLEIDRNAGKLCVARKTEDEIFNTISTKTLAQAGFGGAAYSYAKIRSMLAKRATMKGLKEDLLARKVNYFFEGTTYNFRTIFVSATEEGAALRNFMRKGYAGLTYNELEALERNPAIFREANMLFTQDQGNRLSEFAEIFEKNPKAVSDIAEHITTRNAPRSQTSWFTKLKTTAGRFYTKHKLGISIGTTIAIVGTVAAFQFMLTQDLQATILTTAQILTASLFPKIIQYILEKIGQEKLEAFGERIISAIIPLETTKAATQNIPVFGTPACLVIHAIEVVVNLVFAIYDQIQFDITLYSIFHVAETAVKAEKDEIACVNFNAPKPLLYPANCEPKASLKEPFNNEAFRVVTATQLFASAVLFTAGIPLALTSSTCAPGSSTPSTAYLAGTLIAASATAASALIPITSAFLENPSAIIPRSECDASCTGDCPNWYISASLWDQVGSGLTCVGAFTPLAIGGPICAALSFAGWASLACDAARYMSGLGFLMISPAHTLNCIFQAGNVGFNKQSYGSISSSITGETKIYANNIGFWYAQLPYVIEIEKVYESTTEDLNGRVNNIIISKK
ncbi:MAG: hypothetical protein QW625_01665 [Candidatus Nanoarchaeia archaeon]